MHKFQILKITWNKKGGVLIKRVGAVFNVKPNPKLKSKHKPKLCRSSLKSWKKPWKQGGWLIEQTDIIAAWNFKKIEKNEGVFWLKKLMVSLGLTTAASNPGKNPENKGVVNWTDQYYSSFKFWKNLKFVFIHFLFYCLYLFQWTNK